MTITPEEKRLLRRPFTAEAVKFRIDGKPTSNGNVRILTYIDSRLAAERLSEVDPSWSGEPVFVGHTESDPVGLSVGVPVVYHLTVAGHTRADVGQIGKAQWGDNKGNYDTDDKHAKVAVSDALKRAAVLFGVGAYLYTLGDIYAEVGKHTDPKGKYLNAAGKAYLKKQYADFISKPAFVERFGTPISYGDELKDSVSQVAQPLQAKAQTDTDSSPVDSQKKAAEAQVNAGQSDTVPVAIPGEGDDPTTGEVSAGKGVPDPYSNVIAGIFELLGRSPEAGVLWLSGRKNKKLAVKKTLRQANEKGADTDKLEELLKVNGLEELVPV